MFFHTSINCSFTAALTNDVLAFTTVFIAVVVVTVLVVSEMPI